MKQRQARFPMEAFPGPIQRVARVASDHYGLPLEIGVLAGTSVATAALGMTGSTTAESFFVGVELPGGSAAEQAIEWITHPIWVWQLSSYHDHIRRTGEKSGPGPQVLMSDLDRRLCENAVANSPDSSILSLADTARVGDLCRMPGAEREELLAWFKKVWRGDVCSRSGVPVRIVALWCVNVSDAPCLRNLFCDDQLSFPALVCPWPDCQGRRGPRCEHPRSTEWEDVIFDLLDKRDRPRRFLDPTPETRDAMGLFESSLKQAGLSSYLDPVLDMAERLARSLRLLDDPGAAEHALSASDINRAALIMNWLFQAHLTWLHRVPRPQPGGGHTAECKPFGALRFPS